MIEAVTYTCRTPEYPWEDRGRRTTFSIVNMGQGLLGTPYVICECGHPPERTMSEIAPDLRKAGGA